MLDDVCLRISLGVTVFAEIPGVRLIISRCKIPHNAMVGRPRAYRLRVNVAEAQASGKPRSSNLQFTPYYRNYSVQADQK